MSTIDRPSNIKLLVVGESNVGKTSLIIRYAEEVFSNELSQSMAEDYKRKELLIDGKTIVVDLWDTGGQERFRTITSSFYRGAQAVLFVYDISKKDTFEKMPMWQAEVERYAQQKIVSILVGNKSDVEQSVREVSTEQGKAWATAKGIGFFEVSAKSGSEVEKAFLTCITDVARNLNEDMPAAMRVGRGNEKKKGTCIIL